MIFAAVNMFVFSDTKRIYILPIIEAVVREAAKQELQNFIACFPSTSKRSFYFLEL